MKKQVIELRRQCLSTFQIAEKVDLTIPQIIKICKEARLGGIWLKNMKKEKIKKIEKKEVQRKKEFFEKLEKLGKIPLHYMSDRTSELKKCIDKLQEPIAKPEDVSLKQKNIMDKHKKIADNIIKVKGFEPDI